MLGLRSKPLPDRAAVASRTALRVQPRLVCPVLGRPQAVKVVASSASGVAPSPNEGSNKDAFNPIGQFSPSMGVPDVTMAKGGGGGMGSGSSLGATMERATLNFVMPTPVVQAPKLDDGGSGGDIGKIIHNGGGGGGGDDGDDDDYFGEGDGEGDGDGEGARDGFFRTAIPEQYDKFSIGAVLAEWMKTVAELPAILRQAVQMGLFSSAQLVRFFAMDVRPNLTRTVSRHLPPTLARDFVGRLMADPGFVQKMMMESMFAAAASLWYEYRARGDKFKDEIDLAMINSIGMAAATGATVWLIAPNRSYGSVHKFPWQQMLDKLPNCVFDTSGPLKQYTNQARAMGFFAKMAELSAVGMLTGLTTSLLSSAAVAIRQKSNPEWQPSIEVPNVGRSSAGLAAYFALNANTRYQLIGGMDRFLFERTNYFWTYLVMSGGGRVVSNQVGELSRPWWQGLPATSEIAHPSQTIRRIRKKISKRVPKLKQALQGKPATPEVEQVGVSAAMATAMAASAVPIAVDEVQQFAQGEGYTSVSASSAAPESLAIDSTGVSGEHVTAVVSLHHGEGEEASTVAPAPAAHSESDESAAMSAAPQHGSAEGQFALRQ